MMWGGPFKMPSSAEAEEDKRRKVSGSAAPPQFLERPSALIQNPGTHPDTDADLLHPHSCPPQAALLEVKGWVEAYIPAEHLSTRSCVVDVQEVRRGSDHMPHRPRVVFFCAVFFRVPCFSACRVFPRAVLFGRFGRALC